MEHDHEHIWACVLPEAHHRVLCRLYHLARFLSAAKGRQDEYFEGIVQTRATLRRVLQREPPDQSVVSVIAAILGQDRTFLPYVSKHGGASQALDAAKWRLVLEAGAGAIVGAYLIALEGGQIE